MKSILATLFMSFCLLGQQAAAVSAGVPFANLNVVETISKIDSSQMLCHETNVGMQASGISNPTDSHQQHEIIENPTSPQSQNQDCCEQDCQCCVGCGLSFINDLSYHPTSTIIAVIGSPYFSQIPQTLPELLFRPPITG